MFKKILVPLDGSELAEYALQHALRLSKKTNAELVLLHVVKHQTVLVPEGPELMSQSLYYPETDISRDEELAREYVAGLRHKMGRMPSEFSWQTLLLEGDPASAIVDTAVDTGVDLIIMSTHGYSGVTRWVLGSVTEKVLRQASCPIFVVRNPAGCQHILVTLDGSALAEASLPWGLQLAALLAAKVTLLRVDEGGYDIKQITVDALNSAEYGLGERFRQDIYKQADTYLTQLKQRVQLVPEQREVPVSTAVEQGKAAPAILDYAQKEKVDLIVMSTHGRTGLSRWRYGSVTEKVLRGADCGLLIIQPDSEAFSQD